MLSTYVGLFFLLVGTCHAFTTVNPRFARASPVVCKAQQDGGSFVDGITSDLQTRWRIYQESSAAGYNFKQSLASVIAGEYDTQTTKEQLESLIQSAPCVMFSWKNSPSCKKAIKALDIAGAEYKIVPLDDPWDTGNALRAELGKMVGRPTMPAIFIGGKYAGGFDGGVSEEAPGIVDLAFKGTLRPKLEEVGALK